MILHYISVQILSFVTLSYPRILNNRLSSYQGVLTPHLNITTADKLFVTITGDFSDDPEIYISRDLRRVFQYNALKDSIYLNFYLINVNTFNDTVNLQINFKPLEDDDTYWEISNEDLSDHDAFESNQLLIDLFFVKSANVYKLEVTCRHFFSNTECSRNRINDIVLITCRIVQGEINLPLVLSLPNGAEIMRVIQSSRSITIKTKLLKDLKDKTAICTSGTFSASSKAPYKYMVDVFDSNILTTATKAVTATILVLVLAASITLAIYYIFIVPMRKRNKKKILNYLEIADPKDANDDLKVRCSIRMDNSYCADNYVSGAMSRASVRRQSLRHGVQQSARKSSRISINSLPSNSSKRRVNARRSIRNDLL